MARHQWKGDIVSGNATILVGLAAALVVTAVTIAEMAGTNWHIVLYALVSLFVPLGVAVFRIKMFGIADPGAGFLVFFAGYNGFLLCRIAVGVLSQDLRMPYPISYSDEVYTECAFLSFVFSVMLSATLFLMTLRRHRKRMVSDDINAIAGAAFPVGIVFFGIGILLLFVNISKIGGIRAVLGMSKMFRFELTRDAGTFFPYIPFASVGLMFIALALWKKRNASTFFTLVGLILVWALFGFLLQDRTAIAYALIGVLGIFGFLRGWKLSYKLVASVVLLYLAFTVYGQMRWMIPHVMEGKMTSRAAVEWVQANSAADWVMPENNEFAGPFYSLVYNVDDPMPPRWGKTYLDAFLFFLPKSLYPNKPTSLANEFAQQVHSKFANAYFPVSGWGYSPVAEAFVNFDWPGVVIIAILWGIGLDLLERFRWRNAFGLLCVVSVLPEIQNANRINWTWVWTECLFNVAICAVAVFAARLLANSMQQNRAAVKVRPARHMRAGAGA